MKVFKVRPGRRGTMINTFVNANTIFIGLPLNIALFGNQALPYFLVYYITNTVSTWTLGVYLMTSDSKEALPSSFIRISRSPRIFGVKYSCPKFCGKYFDLYW